MVTAERAAMINRRQFLKTALVTTGVAAAEPTGSGAAAAKSAIAKLVDVNVNLSRWPMRRLRGDDTPSLVAMLRDHGVTEAWAGSFDGLLHKDLAAVNARLAEECRRYGRGLLAPFGSINPKSADWKEELRRCVEEHRMPGIRLHPNYHGYSLADSEFGKLLRSAAERGLVVQIAVTMEDERMMHPLLRVPPLDVTPLAGAIRSVPNARVVLLNAFRALRGEPLLRLIAAGEVCVEISILEGVGGLTTLLSQVPAGRVLFGSNAPFFYFDSALLKLKESPLAEKPLRAICSENAHRLRRGAL